ncbi:hypothetical protein FIE12Z_7848 [Fusarium flagelliforme]|uniref:Uncharacterized protein n=1 Tax=Fusarium flagelliforme TaxID=2675880 RepID=A0A395MKM1_9HYPO|nr:hypothetical protein FIE12Z_7848 [Fusarium flagelliforme]
MAPACCLISVKSKPNQPPPSAEGASPNGTETIPQDSEVTVIFSHTKYAELYMKFLEGKKESENKVSYTSYNKSLVYLKLNIAWRFESDEFVFNNQQDAENWKKLLPFCEISESPEKLKAFDEIKPGKFRVLLKISKVDWSTEWNSSSYTKAAVARGSATESDAQKKKMKEDERKKKAAEEEEDSGDEEQKRAMKEWKRKWRERAKKRMKKKEEKKEK